MSGISSWSIRNPVPTVVLFLVLTLAGTMGFSRLRVNNTPDMDIPTVTVTVTRTGSAPSEMETQVTRLVETAVAGLGNVDHVRSTVAQGTSTTNVEFSIGTNADRAATDVRDAVSSVRSSLPADVLEPTVRRVDATGQPILGFVVDAPAMAPDAVSWLVDNDVSKAVLSVQGVSKIERSGGVEREVQVLIDADRAMALGITASEVSQQLRAANADQPGGRANIGEGEQEIRLLGGARSVADLAGTRLALADGRTVRLSDVGEVRDAWAEPRQRARLDGKEVVSFNVYRTVGSSEVSVAKAVRARVSAFAATRPDVSVREITSSTDWVEQGYEAAIEALWLGGLLAVLVVWAFLRDLRATLVSSVALPLSLMPAFAVMYVLNQSLNNITLLAIALVVGVLVDDAIVEIENIVRHMRTSGKGAYASAMEAADEIGLAVVATTLTIVAVFLPVGFMPGIPGQFFRAFAIAVCTSVLFSLLVARMLTPLMGAYLMRAAGREHDEPRWMGAYLGVLGWTLRHRWATIVAGVAFLAASLALARFIPSDFMPASDRGRSMLSVELPPGSTLAETDAAVLRATAILGRRREVASVYASIGTPTSSGPGPGGGGGGSGEVRSATLTANLVPKGARALSQQAFEAEVGPSLRAIPGARFRFGADGRSGAKAQATLVSDDAALLDATLERVAREMRAVRGFHNVASTSALARPEIQITPKPDKAAALGISATALAQAVNVATVGDNSMNLPKFNLSDRQVDIRVMLGGEVRGDLPRLSALQVRGTDGTLPLSSVADIAFGAGPNQVSRLDRSRTATVEAELSGLTAGEADALIAALPSMRSLPPAVRTKAAGDSERMAELVSGFAFAVLSGVVLVYTVLTLLFRGFMQPVTILTALPLSLGGALGLMLLTGSSFSISALIGILMLMGIAAKNSILLVEYAIVARQGGSDRRTALLDAARKRARPIVMTTVAMGAGMLPIALRIGADAEFRAPMAVAVIGGLLSSTVLSLVYVPAVYTVVDDLQAWLGRRLSRLVVTPAPSEVATASRHSAFTIP